MNTYIQALEEKLTPLRKQLTNHSLYRTLQELEDVRQFMESHVYAVWDFMSLLKALQNHLTCTTLPWRPVANARIARFVNEIVWGEESDFNEKGEPRSHFEMYLDAMKEVGADVQKVEDWLATVSNLDKISFAIENAELQPAEKAFLHFTFEIIQTSEIHKIASAFTFGREDLIPDMFIKIINQSSQEGQGQFPKLKYYLERHIEVDGDEHGPLSLEMIQEVCGSDPVKWKEAEQVAIQALERRIALWDEITQRIEAKKVLI